MRTLKIIAACVTTMAGLLTPGVAFSENVPPDDFFPQLSRNYKSAYTVRACIGEKICPVNVQAMFPCGSTEQGASNNICTIYVGDGRKVISPYRIVHQGDHEGNHCGYAWFLVTCFDP
jgi:hypothetical protein